MPYDICYLKFVNTVKIHLIYLRLSGARSDGDDHYPDQGRHGNTERRHGQPLLNNKKLRQRL